MTARFNVDLFSLPKFDVRFCGANLVMHSPPEYWVWRLNYPYHDGYRDRCVAGPYVTLASAQAAIDEDRIACR